MSEENDDNFTGVEKDGGTENEDVVVQDKSSSDEVKNGGISNASRFVSQREIISIIFSKKTLYHVIVLFSLLLFFGIISYTKSGLASSLILIFGYSFIISAVFSIVVVLFNLICFLTIVQNSDLVISKEEIQVSFFLSGFILSLIHI